MTRSYPGDWVELVRKDIEYLNIDLSFEEIKEKSKKEMEIFIDDKIEKKALEYLNCLKDTHSKMANLKFEKLEMAPYLKPESNLTNTEKSFIMSLRSRTLDVKDNYKTAHSDLLCRGCGSATEDQRHILICPNLNENAINSVENTEEYEDLFKNDTNKLISVGRKILCNFRKLQSLITPL